MSEADLPRIAALISDLLRVIKGQPTPVVHAALVNITADFVVGHEMVGDPKRTHAMRELLIREHFDMVRQLVSAYETSREHRKGK